MESCFLSFDTVETCPCRCARSLSLDTISIFGSTGIPESWVVEPWLFDFLQEESDKDVGSCLGS